MDVLTALMSSVNRKPRLGTGEEAQKHLTSQGVNEWGGRVQLPGSAEGSLNIQGHEFNASTARTLASSSPACSAAAARGRRPGRLRVGHGQGWWLGQVSVENRHDERGNKDLRNRKLRSKSSRPAAQWESRPRSGREGRRKARREHARVLDPRYQAIAPKCRWVAHHAQGTHFDGRAGREPGGCREPGAGVQVTVNTPACTAPPHICPHPALRQTGSFVIHFLLYSPSDKGSVPPLRLPLASELPLPGFRAETPGAFSPQNILNGQVQRQRRAAVPASWQPESQPWLPG